MRATDFVYDGYSLSDYGFMIGKIDSSNGTETFDVGSQITFNTTPQHNGKYVALTNVQYDSCVTCTFQICKIPCNVQDMEITFAEFRDLMRWLNRKEFLPFNFCIETGDIVYFDASFNVKKITVGGILYGLELTMETNRPFGYGDKIVHTLKFSNASQTIEIEDASDEIGYIYPDMKITCSSSGDLSIKNAEQNCTMLVKNCESGEVITISGNAQFITTSSTTHKIANDFNYQFMKIGNTFTNRKNTLSVSSPCSIELSYNPIIKDLM